MTAGHYARLLALRSSREITAYYRLSRVLRIGVSGETPIRASPLRHSSAAGQRRRRAHEGAHPPSAISRYRGHGISSPLLAAGEYWGSGLFPTRLYRGAVMALARPCREPGCPAVATHRGWCAEHAGPAEAARRRRYDAQRASAARRGYDARWRRVRAMVLAREPRCRDCAAVGRLTLATEVHHLDGNPRNNALDNLMPLCKPCHSRRTLRDIRDRKTGL